jgi:hypothetical protein
MGGSGLVRFTDRKGRCQEIHRCDRSEVMRYIGGTGQGSGDLYNCDKSGVTRFTEGTGRRSQFELIIQESSSTCLYSVQGMASIRTFCHTLFFPIYFFDCKCVD